MNLETAAVMRVMMKILVLLKDHIEEKHSSSEDDKGLVAECDTDSCSKDCLALMADCEEVTCPSQDISLHSSHTEYCASSSSQPMDKFELCNGYSTRDTWAHMIRPVEDKLS